MGAETVIWRAGSPSAPAMAARRGQAGSEPFGRACMSLNAEPARTLVRKQTQIFGPARTVCTAAQTTGTAGPVGCAWPRDCGRRGTARTHRSPTLDLPSCSTAPPHSHSLSTRTAHPSNPPTYASAGRPSSVQPKHPPPSSSPPARTPTLSPSCLLGRRPRSHTTAASPLTQRTHRLTTVPYAG